MTVTGTFAILHLDTVKMATLTYTVDVGSVFINQHSTYLENRFLVSSPDGAFCMAAATINDINADTNAKTAAERSAGFTSTTIDASQYTVGDAWMCH